MCNLCYRNFARSLSVEISVMIILSFFRSVIDQHKTHCYGISKFGSNSPGKMTKQTKNNFLHLPRRQQVAA